MSEFYQELTLSEMMKIRDAMHLLNPYYEWARQEYEQILTEIERRAKDYEKRSISK